MSSNIQKQYSPFFKIKRFLTLNQFLLGFPLQTANEECNKFKFNPWIGYSKLLLFDAMVALGFGYISYLFMKATSVWNVLGAFAKKMDKFKLSELDIAVLLGYPMLNLVSNSVYFEQFKNRKERLNKICMLLTEANEKIDNTAKKLDFVSRVRYKSIYAKIVLVTTITLLSGLTLAASYIAMFFSSSTENLSKTEKILYCILAAVINPPLVYPPTSFAADFAVTHLMLEVKESFNKLKDILKYQPPLGVGYRKAKNNSNEGVVEIMKNADMNNCKVDEKAIVSIGFQLIKVVKKIDSTFEGMLMNTYFVCVLSTTANLYSSTTILFNREHAELWVLSAAYLSISCLTISRLFWVTDYSHSLTGAMKKCAYYLDRFVAINVKSDKEGIQLLKQDLRYYSESPINPFSAFTVSTSTFVGVFGTIITYLIVLLQFKVSE